MANGTSLPSPKQDDRGQGAVVHPSLPRSDSRKMPPTLAVRKRVGGYVVGDTVGEGSFGKVRVGIHSLTEEKVAMKIIDKKLIAKREYVRKNLRREAVVLQRLNSHPNIIRLYEVLETANNYYLITEYAEGGSFMKYLCERKRLSERETRKFMRQLISAVDYMHQADVIHRDIKIENFLLDEDSNLKVIDFGLSNILGPDGLLKTQCGSPAYAAPEIFCNSSYGPAVDVWSIGVNMFAMLTGELPFTVDPPTNMTKLHAKIVQGCTIPQYLTRDCKDLLGKLLTANETERITLRDIMRHPWINRGYTRRLYPTQFTNRITDTQLDQNVISSLVASGFDETTIKEAVMQNKPIAETAGYHLLRSRIMKGWGYPEGRAPAKAKESEGCDSDDVIDLESDSLIFTPIPTARSSRPDSSTGLRMGTTNSVKTEQERAKSQMSQKQRTVDQELRLKSTPSTTGKKHSGPLLIDTRKQKTDHHREECPPTREVILEDMRKKLTTPQIKRDSNNNEMNNKDKEPLIIITSFEENSAKSENRQYPVLTKQTTDEVTRDSGKENERERLLPKSLTDPSKRESYTEEVQPQRMQVLPASNPRRAAVEQGCMIIVNGKLAKGSLFSDALKQHQQRSAWTTDTPEECTTPSLGRRAGVSRRGPGLRRSVTDPGCYSATGRRGGDRDSLVSQPRIGDTPYQNHGAFPSHRLGLFYSVTKQLRHYPGTSHHYHQHNQRDGSGKSTRTRSHTAPNGRPIIDLGLKGAPVRSAPQSFNAAKVMSGKDLTLPRIKMDRVGCQ